MPVKTNIFMLKVVDKRKLCKKIIKKLKNIKKGVDSGQNLW